MIHDLIACHSLDRPNTCIMPLNLIFIALTFYAHLKVYFRKIIPNAPDDFLYSKLIFKESFDHSLYYHLHFLKHYLIFRFFGADFLCQLGFFESNHCHCFKN